MKSKFITRTYYLKKRATCVPSSCSNCLEQSVTLADDLDRSYELLPPRIQALNTWLTALTNRLLNIDLLKCRKKNYFNYIINNSLTALIVTDAMHCSVRWFKPSRLLSVPEFSSDGAAWRSGCSKAPSRTEPSLYISKHVAQRISNLVAQSTRSLRDGGTAGARRGLIRCVGGDTASLLSQAGRACVCTELRVGISIPNKSWQQSWQTCSTSSARNQSTIFCIY